MEVIVYSEVIARWYNVVEVPDNLPPSEIARIALQRYNNEDIIERDLVSDPEDHPVEIEVNGEVIAKFPSRTSSDQQILDYFNSLITRYGYEQVSMEDFKKLIEEWVKMKVKEEGLEEEDE